MHQEVHCGCGPAAREDHTVMLRGSYGIAHNTPGLLPHQRHLARGGCSDCVCVAVPGQDSLGNVLFQEVKGPLRLKGGALLYAA